MLRLIRFTAFAFATLAVAACASSKANTASQSAPRKSANVIEAEEISPTGAANVYDAIQRLRPQWLTSVRIRRGGSGDDLQVYVDSNRYGTMNSLRSLSVGGIHEIRYLSASEATNRYGTGHTGGAIVVMMSK
jgi:hypothetical protein